tara:strand:+ start:49 stop:486 length:438 start_codon:yes stop_codon:yes gene_type:complete
VAGSIIANFKAALLTQLQANATLGAVQCTYADPGGSQRREAVFLGDIETDDHVPEALASGRRRRREDFVCELFIEVSSKPTPQTAEARAVELANAVETVLADDPQLDNLSGLMFAAVRSLSMTTVQADQTVVTIRMLIEAKARLQ